MSDFSSDEANSRASRAFTIYGPEGTAFKVTRVPNPGPHDVTLANPTSLGEMIEIRGPGRAENLWIATSLGDFVPAPDDAIAGPVTALAEIALRSWLEWERLIDGDSPAA